MRRIAAAVIAAALLASAGVRVGAQNIVNVGPSVDFSHGRLVVSKNHRFLQHQDGTPFLYLGDTAWELFHRLDRELAGKYLDARRRQGFTVIQAVVLAEFDGLTTPERERRQAAHRQRSVQTERGLLCVRGLGGEARGGPGALHRDAADMGRQGRARELGQRTGDLPGGQARDRARRGDGISARATRTRRTSSGFSAAIGTARASSPCGTRWPRASPKATAAAT